MSLFKRNLNKCGQDITLQNRNIQAPVFGSADADLEFSGDTVVKAIVSTKRGSTLFDGVSTDEAITHKVSIEFISGVTAETWILLGSRRLDVVDVENCGEQDKVLNLLCNERGNSSQEASKA